MQIILSNIQLTVLSVVWNNAYMIVSLPACCNYFRICGVHQSLQFLRKRLHIHTLIQHVKHNGHIKVLQLDQ